MRIEVLYKSHRYEEFDTSVQTTNEPYRGKGTTILTDWNLYLGQLKEQGVVLVQHWYDGNPANCPGNANLDGLEILAALRKKGCAMLLVAPEELNEIVWLKKDGEKLLWREGEDLINGERFFAMEQMCYSDATTISVNRRALAVFKYLQKANPELGESEIAESMGYTMSAIERIEAAETAQDDGFADGEFADDEADGYGEEFETDVEDETGGEEGDDGLADFDSLNV